MKIKRPFNIMLMLASFLVLGALQPFKTSPVFGQDQCQTFNETGMSVCGRFLQYWQLNGGLMQQGFPISNEFQEIADANGQTYTVQYFERAVFEKHPENQPPYDVLLAQLGRFQLNARYARGEPVAEGADPSPNEVVGRYFNANGFDGGVAIAIQKSLLSKRLAERAYGRDPSHGILGPGISSIAKRQYAPGTDFSGARPVWILLVDDKGTTTGIFTMVKENGAWR